MHMAAVQHRSGRRLALAVAVSAGYWLLESSIHVFVLHSGNFTAALMPHGANELWMRGVIVLLLCCLVTLVPSPDEVADAGKRPRLALARAVDQADEGIVITSPDGRILYANPAFTDITGYTLEEIAGRTPAVLSSGVQSDAYYRRMWKTIKGGQVWSGSITDRRRDGSYYPVKLTIVPVTDSEGSVTHFVGIQRDQSEYAALRARLDETAKMARLGELAGRIAHDFNNGLATVAAIAGVASRRARGNPELEELLSSMGVAVDSAGTLPRQLLAFARKGDAAEPVGSLDAAKFVDEVGPVLRMLVPDSVKLEILPPEAGLEVRADAHGLQHVLANLLLNAVDAVADQPDGRIRIEFDKQTEVRPGQDAPELVIRISDNGAGVPRDRHDKIFEPFFTTKGPERGTGLGLPNALGMVRRFGGDLRLEPVAERGATFAVLLPLVG